MTLPAVDDLVAEQPRQERQALHGRLHHHRHAVQATDGRRGVDADARPRNTRITIVSDQLEKVLYESPAGPITPHDVMFGLGAAVARGHVSMAHRCGFTPSAMLRHLHKVTNDYVKEFAGNGHH